MDYFHCSRFLFFKTAGDFLYLCNIHRIVENSREPCTPPSQSCTRGGALRKTFFQNILKLAEVADLG
ncbi:hypothetical protein T03_16511 [Trichinella britovi]|uniref:Uncharacterized protein n=1 Tax=Trichinella britovi TaxID=45882 RepID=A0A0V1AJS6_TRIBR|nr:hypothetical protein T03_16511 [Trichinella britovi]